jgi:hypothetical protein
MFSRLAGACVVFYVGRGDKFDDDRRRVAVVQDLFDQTSPDRVFERHGEAREVRVDSSEKQRR